MDDEADLRPGAEAMALVPAVMCEVYKVVPLTFENGVLTVACGSETEGVALDDMRHFLGVKEVKGVVAAPERIAKAIDRISQNAGETVLDVIRAIEGDMRRGQKRDEFRI